MSASIMNIQNEATLNKMVEAAFNCKMKNAVLCEGGFCNAVYNITLEDGTECILKIAGNRYDMFMSYEQGMFDSEIWAMKLIGEKTSVPMPKLLFVDKSHRICNSDYFFMSKLDGVPLNNVYDTLTLEQQSAAISELGGWSREMSSIVGSKFGYMYNDKLQGDTNKEFVLKLMKSAVDDEKKVGTELGFISWDSLYELFLQFSTYLDDCKTPYFVHWDLWKGNIMIKDGIVQGLIDFERALYADPLFEHEFSGPEQPDMRFLKRYGKTSFTESEEIRCILYRLHHISTMTMEGDFRHYNDTGMRDWSISLLKAEVEKLKNMRSI